MSHKDVYKIEEHFHPSDSESRGGFRGKSPRCGSLNRGQRAGFAPAASLTCARDAAADAQRPHSKLWFHAPAGGLNVGFVIKVILHLLVDSRVLSQVQNTWLKPSSFIRAESLFRLCVTWPINPATDAVQGLGGEAKIRLYNPSRGKNLCFNCDQLICGCNRELSHLLMQFDAANVHYAQVETLNGTCMGGMYDSPLIQIKQALCKSSTMV